MEVLDYIDLATVDPKYVAQRVQEYIAARKDMISSLDVVVRVSICKEQKTARATKSERIDTLAQLIEVSGVSDWGEGKYNFDFENGKYMHGKKELYVTPGEAVALYQKLVRGQDAATWASFYANMKKKLGQDFLQGVV